MMPAERKKSWAHIAELILRESDQPLTAEVITGRAFRAGLKVSSGQVPGGAVQRAIRDDMAERGDASHFVTVKRGKQILYALKEVPSPDRRSFR